jgi:hypothetical protein
MDRCRSRCVPERISSTAASSVPTTTSFERQHLVQQFSGYRERHCVAQSVAQG